MRGPRRLARAGSATRRARAGIRAGHSRAHARVQQFAQPKRALRETISPLHALLAHTVVNLAEILSEHVRARPATPAIIEGRGRRTRVCTFAELDERSRRAATLLHEAGVQPGDQVLIFQPMSVELYEAMLAVFRLGATAMFLDPGTGLDHIKDCCERGKPVALIA